MQNNTKKKILLIIHLPPPIHGVSMVNSHVKRLIKENNELWAKIVAIRSSKKSKNLQKNGFIKVIYSFSLFVRITSILFSFKPKKVYFTPSPIGVVFYRDLMIIGLCKIFKCEIILHFHRQGLESFSTKRWIRNLLKRTTLIHLTPYLVEKEFINHNFHVDSTTHCIPNPLIKQPHLAENHHKKDNQLLFFSNLIPEKGVIELIKAFSLVVQKTPAARLVIAGAVINQTYFNDIQKTIEDEGLTKYITISANPDESEKIQLFNQSSIFALPSNEDCFPIVILEALSYGIPVITTRVGGLHSVLQHQTSGVYYTNNSTEELSNCLTYVFQRKISLEFEHIEFLLKDLTEVFNSKIMEILNG